MLSGLLNGRLDDFIVVNQTLQLKETEMDFFEQNIQVRSSDLDPNGHVRHSVYYDYGVQPRINLTKLKQSRDFVAG
ncbi:MAG: hypothetical protein QM483_03015 [Desulfuromusa sp.]